MLRISNFREPLAKKFAEFPYSKPRKLEITINAPLNYTDDEQLYFMFRHVYDLVDFLLLH